MLKSLFAIPPFSLENPACVDTAKRQRVRLNIWKWPGKSVSEILHQGLHSSGKNSEYIFLKDPLPRKHLDSSSLFWFVLIRCLLDTVEAKIRLMSPTFASYHLLMSNFIRSFSGGGTVPVFIINWCQNVYKVRKPD